jgi:hypothetical protein
MRHSNVVDQPELLGLGRIDRLSNSAPVGLAALAQYEGDIEWATESIVGARCQRDAAFIRLDRMVAEQIGVRDDFIEQQETAVLDAARNEPTSSARHSRSWTCDSQRDSLTADQQQRLAS